ncbi:MAG TPA: FtsX-like permease family protein [Gammaproteobacteria bacterium]|nr:FtsX-like permease family protein [Gammaproteobacteria bacterium]
MNDYHLRNPSAEDVYVPIAQVADPVYGLLTSVGGSVAWLVRRRGDSAALDAAIQDSILEATGLPVVDVEPAEHLISASVSRQRLNMLLMSIFGGAALLFAAIGIYGVMAYSVQQRTQEIGIRLALGADAVRVRSFVIRQGMVLVVTGIVAGLGVALLTAKVLASFLFGVEPHDTAVFAAVPIILASIGFASVWMPAQRASKVDPLEALRCE